MTEALPLIERYWYIDGTNATRIDVEPGEFWRQLMTGEFTDPIVGEVAQANGWLVSIYDMDRDMDMYEMHPEGDELHFLVSGRLDLVLLLDTAADDHNDEETVIPMLPGTCTAVTRGVWHRFVVHEPSRGLAVTAGRGTQHRPI